jgi:hypothetical protein
MFQRRFLNSSQEIFKLGKINIRGKNHKGKKHKGKKHKGKKHKGKKS